MSEPAALPASEDRLILLGEIGPAHGVRGEVVVRSHTAMPEDIAAYGPLHDETGRRTFALTVVRVTPKGVVVKIAGFGDRTAVEALRGTRLYVPRSKLPHPAAGEFYHEDLIGLEAAAPDGSKLGTVVGVQNFGAGDLIEIRRTGARETEFVPFTDAAVPTVDTAARRIVVVMPEMVEGPEMVEDEDEGSAGAAAADHEEDC